MGTEQREKKSLFSYILIRVILFCFALLLFFLAVIVNILYPIFWERNYNVVVMDHLSDDQIEFVNEQWKDKLPINAENIELKWEKNWQNERSICLLYETPNESERYNVLLIILGNLDETNLTEVMVLQYGEHQALPLLVELILFNSVIIGAIIVITIVIQKKFPSDSSANLP